MAPTWESYHASVETRIQIYFQAKKIRLFEWSFAKRCFLLAESGRFSGTRIHGAAQENVLATLRIFLLAFAITSYTSNTQLLTHDG